MYVEDFPYHRFSYNVSTQRPIVPVSIRDSYGGWQTFPMLADSGNDITIINMATADSLGLDLNMGSPTGVKGIGPGLQPYRQFEHMQIKIGDTEPVGITLLVGNTDLNLLGRRDIYDKFEVRYTPEGGIHFIQRSCEFCNSL